MDDKITMNCQGCGGKYELPRTPDVPDFVKNMKCNWCPKCEDKATDYYKEWYSREPKTKCKKQAVLFE